MKKILIAVLLLSGCTSLEKQQSNEQAQVAIVKVQREALAREESSRAQAQIALYESLAKIAEVSPDSADAAVLAMAMVGQGSIESSENAPLLALREQRNEAIELTKALAPTLGGVITNVGLAAVNASVQKRQIAATAAVQIQDSNNDAAIVNSVANLGVAAVGAAGDAITVTDDAWVNMGSYTDNDTTTTTTTTNTETNTTTNAETNTTTADSNNTTTPDNSVYTYTTTDTVSYGGQELTLGGLLAYLKSTGLAYSLRIGGDVYTVDGDGEPTEITCGPQDGGPQFSPALPICEA
jgi:hypothetical protein